MQLDKDFFRFEEPPPYVPSKILYRISEFINIPRSEAQLVEGSVTAAAPPTPTVEREPKEAKEPKEKKFKPDKERASHRPPLPKDEQGNTILPVKLGNIEIAKLGTVVWDKPKYHSERYIFPVGFESNRTYFSLQTADERVLYISRILDGGDAPIFEVESCETGEKWQASSTSGVWAQVMKRINDFSADKGGVKRASGVVSGPDMFGLSNPSVVKSIQELPNANKCANYIPSK